MCLTGLPSARVLAETVFGLNQRFVFPHKTFDNFSSMLNFTGHADGLQFKRCPFITAWFFHTFFHLAEYFPVCTGATSEVNGRNRAKRSAEAFLILYSLNLRYTQSNIGYHTHTHTDRSPDTAGKVRCLIIQYMVFFLSVQNNKSYSITCAGRVQKIVVWLLSQLWPIGGALSLSLFTDVMKWGSSRSAGKKPKINI